MRRSPACSSRPSNRSGADWAPLVAAIAAATMILGTVVGVAQSNLKRMLGVFEHRARRISAGGLVAANDVGKGRDSLLPAGVRRDQPRRLRRDRAARHAGAAERRAARLRRPVAHASPACRADDGMPAVARRAAADRRVHRQVVHLQRRRQRRLLRPGDHRRADQRGVGLLLPARRRDDVHGRARCRRPGARAGDGIGMAALALAIVAIFYLGILPSQVLTFAAESISTIF